MKNARSLITRFVLAAMLLAAVCQGCAAQTTSDSTRLTLEALQTQAAQTAAASAAASTQVSPASETRVPGETRSPGETKSVSETKSPSDAIQKATATMYALQTSEAALSRDRESTKIAATTIAAPVVAELPQYGLDPANGRVGWVHNPLKLEVTGYQQFAYGNDHPEVIAADFALAADLTWDTQYGSSGCGFMFRSDGKKNKPNQYMLIATRFANGHVVFTALADGEIANIHDFYPKSEDRSFNADNKTTNRLAVVARGNIIEIYTNYAKVGEVDTTKPPAQLPAPPKPIPPPDQTNTNEMNAYKDQMKEYEDILQRSQSSFQLAVKNYMNRPAVFTEGFVSMFAASESGRTVCTFNKAWLWLINK